MKNFVSLHRALYLTSYMKSGIEIFMKIYSLIFFASIFLNLGMVTQSDAATCTATDKQGVLQCFDQEQERREEETLRSEEELLVYCQKTVGITECSALSERIEARRKAMSAYKVYLEGLDSVKKGLIDLGRAANNTLQQHSKDLDDFFNSIK